MTCIVGLVHKNKVYIGGDSAGVSDLDISIREDVKVFKNGDFLIGCTSSFRMIQILQFDFVPPEQPAGVDDLHYMVSIVVPRIQQTFKDSNWEQKDTFGAVRGGVFLIGYKGRLYSIQSDFQVAINLDQVDAIGCGGMYALSALYALPKKLHPKKKIKKALEISVYLSGGVRPPFIIESI